MIADPLKEEYFTEEEVAQMLHIAYATLQTRRYRGQNHPPYIKLNKKAFYPKKDFHAWLKRQKLVTEIRSA